MYKRQHAACAPFYDGMHENKVPWCIVGVPSPRWAKAVFPSLPEDEAMAQLWEAIFKTVRADTPDPVAAWRRHKESFAARIQWLNSHAFAQLHYHNGRGTDTVSYTHLDVYKRQPLRQNRVQRDRRPHETTLRRRCRCDRI